MRTTPPQGDAHLPANIGPEPDGVDLLWIPLGAGVGGALVRWSGRAYEAIAAGAARRRRQRLFHSALEVHRGGVSTAIEMAPVWVTRGERGVVAQGPVGLRPLGRWRLFRYEIRRWTGGVIPDRDHAVGGPLRVSSDPAIARRVLELVPAFPTGVWGRDDFDAGEMWNSNSLASWLLASAGVAAAGLDPPGSGRAPGWRAGIELARRTAPH